jgi:4-amino-4-deoxy-L-arabinose transferase-like glycosyltransferase
MIQVKNTTAIFSPFSIIIGVALLFRLAIVVFFTPPLLQDEMEYFSLAQSLHHGNGFSIEGTPTAYRAPAYPAFIVIVFSIFGESVISVRMLQVFADTLTCVLLFLLCRRFFSEDTAFIALAAYSFFPGNALYISLFMTEVLFTAFTLLAILLCTKQSPAYPTVTKILLGMTFGIITLLKPNALIIFTAFLIWEIIRSRSFKKGLQQNVLIIISFIVLLFPWMIRNKIYFDHFSITSNGGVNFWIGHNQSANGSFKYLEQNNPLENIANEFDRSTFGYKEGIDFLIHHPTEEAKLLFLKFAHFFEPDFSLMKSLQYKPEWDTYSKSILIYREFSPSILFGMHCLTAIIVITGLWGLIFANDSQYQYLLLVRLIIVFWIGSYLIFFGAARFRLPIMPLFIAMATYSIEAWKTKSFSVTQSKIFLFSLLTLLLLGSWTATFMMLYFK